MRKRQTFPDFNVCTMSLQRYAIIVVITNSKVDNFHYSNQFRAHIHYEDLFYLKWIDFEM